MTLLSTKALVQKELRILVLQNLCEEELDVTDDDSLLDYISGVIDENVSENLNEFDFDSLITMISAYLPSLEDMPHEEIKKWLSSLLQKAQNLRKHEHSSRKTEKSESPSCSTLEDFSLQLSPEEKQAALAQSSANSTKKKSSMDPELKNAIASKHSLVADDSNTFHRPSSNQKTIGQPSKVRYLDGRVVSTKGDKFVQMKSEESEEMKKTYVNLKPARKYRFH